MSAIATRERTSGAIGQRPDPTNPSRAGGSAKSERDPAWMEEPMNKERSVKVLSGWIVAPVTLALYAAAGVLFWQATVNNTRTAVGRLAPQRRPAHRPASWRSSSRILSTPGYFTLQPNEARLLILFGDYGAPPARAASAGATRSTPTGRRPGPVARVRRRGRQGRHRRHAGRSPSAALQGLAAGPHAERRQAQGQRQGGQPDRDRRGRGVARRGHRAGHLRRRRLRGLRLDAERDGAAPPGHGLRLRPRRGAETPRSPCAATSTTSRRP